eukprot:scaffold72184_cov61-Phaeocystis_antarctica.AAC.2
MRGVHSICRLEKGKPRQGPTASSALVSLIGGWGVAEGQPSRKSPAREAPRLETLLSVVKICLMACRARMYRSPHARAGSGSRDGRSRR